MLDSLRKSAESWVMKALMVVLVISFAFWGVSGFQSARVENVASVGGRDISRSEYEINYHTQLRLLSAQYRTNISSGMAQSMGVPQQVLSELIGNTAIAVHADKLGLGIDDQFVRNQIEADPMFANDKGHFDRTVYTQALEHLGMNSSYYTRLRREQAIRSQILNVMTSGAHVPQTLLDAVNHYVNDQRVVKYFAIPLTIAGTVDAPDEAALKAYYDENATKYKAPQYRKIGVLVLTADSIKDRIAFSEDEIKAGYEARKKKYATPEQRTIQQIIFKDKAQAEAARAKLNENTDFVKFGAEFGMKEGDVNMGTFAADAMADKKIAAAAFKLKQGEISQVIDGFAPVIVRVTEIKPASQSPYEEVKAEVRDELAKPRASEMLSKFYDQIEDSRGGGTSLEETGKRLNIKYEELVTDAGGNGMDGKRLEALMPEVLKQSFNSEVGVENPPLTVAGGSAFVDIKEIIPERQKPLAEVRDSVQKAWIEQETQKRLEKVAQEILRRAAGESMEKLAEAVQGKVTTSKPLKRNDKEEELPASLIKQAFSQQVNGFGSVKAPDGKSIVVFQVTEIKPAEGLDEKKAEEMRVAVSSGLGNDLAIQYVNGLKNAYGVQVNSGAISPAAGSQQ